MKLKQAIAWLSAPLVVGFGGWLLWRETRRPLRRETESKLRRNARNLAIAGASALALQIAERPVIEWMAKLVERRKWGLLKRLPLPRWLETTLAIVLMDYTLYHWHVLTHRAPWLWRFHVVHHIDLDLDTSTALRFHFAELVASVP